MLDKSVKIAKKFAEKHSDTLIIVTCNHILGISKDGYPDNVNVDISLWLYFLWHFLIIMKLSTQKSEGSLFQRLRRPISWCKAQCYVKVI